MKKQKESPRTICISTFTPNEYQRKNIPVKKNESNRSRFSVTPKHKGTFGTSYTISMNNRRKYKYDEK